jgi:site-specific DNA-methyltransferase (adenine-specific)
MKMLSVNSFRVDVIVTSPPYNIDKKYASYKDNKEKNEYLNWHYKIAKLSSSILNDSGSSSILTERHQIPCYLLM